MSKRCRHKGGAHDAHRETVFRSTACNPARGAVRAGAGATRVLAGGARPDAGAESVKSLVAFPQVLARVDENPDWTRSLGDAFLAQQPHVTDTVQQLRRRAQASGNLVQDDRARVIEQSNSIAIAPSNPRFVYVPYYDPWMVYGTWWWPAYPPVVWAPWPGYVRYHRPGVSVGLWWGAPIGLSVNFFFGNFDWRHRHVRVVHLNNYYYRPPLVVNRAVVVTPQRWRHDPSRRRGIALRVPVVAQPAAAPVASKAVVPATRESRTEFRNRVDRPRNEVRVDSRVESRIERRAEPRNERGNRGSERS